MVGRCGEQELVIALFRRHIGAVRQRALEVDDGEVIGEENIADVRKGEVVVVIVLLQLIHPDAGGLSAVSADGEVPRCGQRDENRTVLLVDGDGLVILVEQDVVCVARLTVCVFDHIGVNVGENVIEVEVVLGGNESGEQQEHQQQGCYSAHFWNLHGKVVAFFAENALSQGISPLRRRQGGNGNERSSRSPPLTPSQHPPMQQCGYVCKDNESTQTKNFR